MTEPTLSAGAIKQIYDSGDTSATPTVQVWDVKRIGVFALFTQRGIDRDDWSLLFAYFRGRARGRWERALPVSIDPVRPGKAGGGFNDEVVAPVAAADWWCPILAVDCLC